MHDYLNAEQRQHLANLIGALNSERYCQGSLALNKNGNFCVHGVACDLFANETGVGTWKEICGSYFNFSLPEVSSSTSAPKEVLDYFGINNPIDQWLMRANDIVGMTFPQIADYLQKNLLENYNPEVWNVEVYKN